VRSNVKTMLICFFDIQGILHREFIPRGQTVNQEFYLGVLKRLRERVWRTRPELWRTGEWLIHHDNAPTNMALRIRQFLTSQGMTLVPHPPYSPDLAPADFFFCFPKWKGAWKGGNLTLWRTLSQLRQECWTASKLRSSRDVSNSGNRDWISAYHPMESTLKATNVFFVIL